MGPCCTGFTCVSAGSSGSAGLEGAGEGSRKRAKQREPLPQQMGARKRERARERVKKKEKQSFFLSLCFAFWSWRVGSGSRGRCVWAHARPNDLAYRGRALEGPRSDAGWWCEDRGTTPFMLVDAAVYTRVAAGHGGSLACLLAFSLTRTGASSDRRPPSSAERASTYHACCARANLA